MADKGKLEIETLDAIEPEREQEPVGHVSDSEKPAVRHYELAKGQPYWDTKYVIGASASRGEMSEASFTSQDEVRRRPGVIKRFWLHYKRHWKLYGVLTVIALAIGLPILFLVIFPAIAQRLVDDANLPIESARIMKPTPDSVEYSLTASLKVPAGVAVDLKPMTLSLYTKEMGHKDPYIKVDLPKYHLKGKTTVTITNQTAEILDKAQFQDFLDVAVKSKRFTISAYGTTAAYLGKLKANIRLNKDVYLTGLNNLTGFSFAQAAVVLPPESDGTNIKGTVILPNPSIVTFELGNVTLNMIVGGLVVGHGTIQNVFLRPGNNTVPIRATLDIQTALSNLPLILASQVNALKSGNVEVSASGNSTIYNGQHIPYYEAVLNKLVVTGQVPIIQLLIDSAAEFLGTDSSLISGFLGNLNITGIIDALDGIGGGNSTASGSSNLLGDLLGGLTGAGNSTANAALLSSLITLGTRALSSRSAEADPAPNLAASLMSLYVKSRLGNIGKKVEERSEAPSSPENVLSNIMGLGLDMMKGRTKPEQTSTDAAPANLLSSLIGLGEELKKVQRPQEIELRTPEAAPANSNLIPKLIGLGLKTRMAQGQESEPPPSEPLAETLLRQAETLKSILGQ